MSNEKYVVTELRKAIDTYKERNAVYKDTYKIRGKVMEAIFPDGVVLKTAKDFNRFGMFTGVISKMIRYAAQLDNGGHYDSAHDAEVYAAMLNEIENEE